MELALTAFKIWAMTVMISGAIMAEAIAQAPVAPEGFDH